jgi:putative alpha-1,2-mannosidase
MGFHRYTFPDSRQSHIIIDLEHRDLVLESWIEFVGDSEVRGMRRSKNWAEDHVVYFHMKFSKPFSDQGITVNKNLIEDTSAAHGENIIAFVEFHTEQDEHILVKVGISAVSTEGALRNLEAEVPHWDFDKTREEARQSWNDILGKIEVGGGADFNIHTAEGFTNYTVFSLWDTYRTWHPLMTIIDTRRTNDFIGIFLDQYEKRGLLPVWELAANETFCMIGYHSVSVIADAWVKGIRDYDGALALEAMQHSANQNHLGLEAYRTYGHIPGDKEHESISKTLEYAYDDWCIAQMAKSLEREDIYTEYIRRAQYYKNIFDSSTGFIRPKMNGNWITPFDPTRVDWHFPEANSWQYSFYVPQDIGRCIYLYR